MLIDIAVIIVFLAICVISYRRGFLATLLSLASGVLSLVLVYMLAGPVAATLKQTGMFDGFRTNVETSVAARLSETGGQVTDVLAGLGIPQAWSAGIAEQSLTASTDTAFFLADRLTELLAGMVAIVLLFLFFQIVVRFFLKRLALGVNRIPIIGTLNRIGGFLLGALWGLLLIYLCSVLMSALAPSVPLFAGWLNESFLLRYMTEIPLFLRAYDAIVKKP